MQPPEKEGFFDHIYQSLTTNKQIQDSLKYGIGAATTFSLISFMGKGLPNLMMDFSLLLKMHIFRSTWEGNCSVDLYLYSSHDRNFVSKDVYKNLERYFTFAFIISDRFYFDYTRIKENLKMQQYEAAMKYKVLTRGTDEDPDRDRVREIEDYFPSKEPK